MGADDLGLGEHFDEAGELVRGDGALACIYVPYGFRGVSEYDEVSGNGDFHNGGHDPFVIQPVALGIRVEFSDASGPEVGAPFYLCDRDIAVSGVDCAKGDQAVGESLGGLKDVVIGLHGEFVDLPAHA